MQEIKCEVKQTGNTESNFRCCKMQKLFSFIYSDRFYMKISENVYPNSQRLFKTFIVSWLYNL